MEAIRPNGVDRDVGPNIDSRGGEARIPSGVVLVLLAGLFIWLNLGFVRDIAIGCGNGFGVHIKFTGWPMRAVGWRTEMPSGRTDRKQHGPRPRAPTMAADQTQYGVGVDPPPLHAMMLHMPGVAWQPLG